MAWATVIRNRAPNVIVLWLVAATVIAGLASLSTPARALNCSRTGGPPTPGDWTVSDAEVCDGIVIANLSARCGINSVRGPRHRSHS